MVFANRMIGNKKNEHRTYPLVTIPDRPSMFYDKTLCQEFEKYFPFNYPQEKDNSKKLIKK